MTQKLLNPFLSLLLLLCFHCTANAVIHVRVFKNQWYPEIKEMTNFKYSTNFLHLETDKSNEDSQTESSVSEKYKYWPSIPAILADNAQNNYDGAKHNKNLSHIGKKKMYHKRKMDDFTSKKSNLVTYIDKNELTLLQDPSLETLADFAIDMLNQEIKRGGHSKIKIPDINETFYEKIGPLRIKGEFHARNGWFYSLSSLYRTDEVHISQGGNVLTVLISVGLKKMMIDYDEYRLKFMSMGPRGKINAQVASNSIEVILTVDISDSRCKIKLADLKITTFSGLKMNITGLGRLNSFGSKVATWIIDLFQEEIKEKVEKIIAKALEGVLDNVKC